MNTKIKVMYVQIGRPSESHHKAAVVCSENTTYPTTNLHLPSWALPQLLHTPCQSLRTVEALIYFAWLETAYPGTVRVRRASWPWDDTHSSAKEW